MKVGTIWLVFRLFWSTVFTIVFFVLSVICKGIAAALACAMEASDLVIKIGLICCSVISVLSFVYYLVDIFTEQGMLEGINHFAVVFLELVFIVIGLLIIWKFILQWFVILISYIIIYTSNAFIWIAAFLEALYIYFLQSVVFDIGKA